MPQVKGSLKRNIESCLSGEIENFSKLTEQISVVSFKNMRPTIKICVSHWSVIKHRPLKQDIEPGNYNTQNLEKMADLYGEI